MEAEAVDFARLVSADPDDVPDDWALDDVQDRVDRLEAQWRWCPQTHTSLSAFARSMFAFPTVRDLGELEPKDALQCLTDGAWEAMIMTSKLNLMLTRMQSKQERALPQLNRCRQTLARIEGIVRLCLKSCTTELHAFTLAHTQQSPGLLESATRVVASLSLENKPTFRTRVFQELAEVFAARRLRVYKGRVHQPMTTRDGRYRFCYEQCQVGGEEDTQNAGKVLPWVIHHFRTCCEWSLEDVFLVQQGHNPLTMLREVAENIDAGTVGRSFPRLDPEMTAISYLNGVYMAQDDCFFPFEAVPDQDMVCGARVDCEYQPSWDDETLDNAQYLQLPENEALARTEFGRYAVMIDKRIPTPLMDEVLKYHNIDAEGIAHTYAWGGKLRYPKMLHDKWQREIMALGPPGCGKSLLVHVWRKTLPTYAIASLSSNAQEKFGISAIAGCTTYVCSETTSEFGRNVSAGEFASMISGEEVSLNVKYNEPRTMTWRSNGLFAGNDVPFKDNVGKMIRRFFVVPMSRALPHEKQDGSLTDRILAQELGAVIKKNNVLYLKLAKMHGEQDPSAWMTKQFKQAIEAFAMDSSSLMCFLRSANVVRVDPQQYMDINNFKGSFYRWHTRMGNKDSPQVSTSVLNGALGQIGARVGTAPDTDPVLGGKQVVFGLALVDEDQQPQQLQQPQQPMQVAAADNTANARKRQRGFV